MAKTRGRRASSSTFEGSFLHHALIALVALKLAGIVVLFDPFALDQFGLPKALWSRALEWLIGGALVVMLARFGTAPVPRTRLHVLVGAVGVVGALATLGAADGYLALYGDRERYAGLTFVGDMLVLYLAIAVSCRRQRDWAVIGAALGAAVALGTGYAALQHVGLDPLTWSDDSRTRPIGTFGNPAALGVFAVVMLAAALGVGILAGGPRRWAQRGAVAVLVPVAGAGFALAGERAALGGLLAALAALPFVFLGVRGVGRRAWLQLSAALLVVSVAAVLLLSDTPLGDRALATLSGEGTSDRTVVYAALGRGFLERPLLGWGPDNVVVAWVRNRPLDGDPGVRLQLANSAHSWVLQAGVTTGAAGLAALLTTMYASTAMLWRVRQDVPLAAGGLLLASAAYWTTSLVAVGSVATDWFPWLAFGGAAALGGHSAGAVPGLVRSVSPWGRRGVVAAVVLLALLGALSGTRALGADHAAMEAQSLSSAGRHGEAIRSGLAAVSQDPGRATAWRALGGAYYVAGLYRDAGDAFVEAARRAPYDVTNLLNLAKSRAQQVIVYSDLTRGGPKTALDAARRAVEIDPNYVDARTTLAETALTLGDPMTALREILVALRLDPGQRDAYEPIAARSALRVSPTDREAARTELLRAVATDDSVVLRVSLAEVSYALGDLGATRDHAARALVLQPSNNRALALLRLAGG